MTAEIAILNRTAVALAADSAVSIQHGRGFKIYETHKLFNLSKTYPVGIMIYGNADIMNVPWETIIKHYRQQNGETPQDTLEEYGAKFVTYLNGNISLFPETVQNDRAISHVAGYLLLIRKSIDDTIESITHKALKVKPSQIRDTVRDKINAWHEYLVT